MTLTVPGVIESGPAGISVEPKGIVVSVSCGAVALTFSNRMTPSRRPRL